MANKRMFSNDVISNDTFLEMPDSSQNLYFHLSMGADDDGFISNYKSIMRMLGKKEDDLKVLILKNFVIPFENGILVIRHWRMNNYIQKDRYKETVFKKEKLLLSTDENNVYNLDTNCIHSIDKNRIDKISIDKNRIETEESMRETEIFQKLGLYTETNLSEENQNKLNLYQNLVRELIDSNQFSIIDKLNLNILEKCYLQSKGNMNYLKAYVLKEIALLG
jgi:hypothetical protein